MRPQDQIKALLGKCGIPAKEIDCYGQQIVVTCRSRDAAEKFADLLSKFAKVRGMIESSEPNKVNNNTVLKPSRHKVWRTYAVIQ